MMRKCHRCAGAVEAHNYTTHQEWHEEQGRVISKLMDGIRDVTSELDRDREYRLEQNG